MNPVAIIVVLENQNDAHLRSEQKKLWDVSAPWLEKWLHVTQVASQAVTDRMMELAGIKPGDTVLDIATGIGDPAIDAARIVQPTGRVLAVDQSQRRLATARRRAKEQGLENLIEFIESDVEIMEFPSSKFNAILSKWGLMFFADLERLLSRILDALLPDRGGVFVAAVWSKPEKVPSMKIPSLVLDRLEVPPLPTAVNPFRLSDMSVLSKLFIEAGFEDVKIEAVPVMYRFDSAEDYFDFAYETSGIFKGRITNAAAFLSDEKQDKIKRDIVDEARSFVDSKGQLSMSNETLLIAGRRGLG
ncbi:MAG TPA: class I SAM-dependent methyltransferase [Nitrososphaeraceae archaeon]|nr:class I SAM-dependent methyltransferase [Nitrososphaeraceae archaeon]